MPEQFEFELVQFETQGKSINFSLDPEAETVWATQQQMAELFGISRPAISKHITNIYAEGELDPGATSSKMEEVRLEGGRTVARMADRYNLDVILSVGYRVSSQQATKFRQWATQILKSYLVNGYALNEQRLVNDPNSLRKLAAKVRALRSDEKQIYQQVRDCFMIASCDYDKDAPETRAFYTMLQDKFLYAVTGKTAAQVVLERADHKKPNMGLTAMKGGKPTIHDITVGKNYLEGVELHNLHIICEQFLLFVESAVMRGKQLTMKDMSKKFDEMLKVQGYTILTGYSGFVKKKAESHARQELEAYRIRMQKLTLS